MKPRTPPPAPQIRTRRLARWLWEADAPGQWGHLTPSRALTETRAIRKHTYKIAIATATD